MKKTIIHLVFFTVFAVCGFCTSDKNEELKKNPGLSLNFQDVPIFVQGNPLDGLNAFVVLPPDSIQNQEVNKKIQSIIEKELGSIGKVIKAKSDDVSGFGTGNLLNIQIGKVSAWDEKQMPVTRVTLNVETPVVMTKSKVNSLPRVWTINTFVDAPLDLGSEEKMIGAVQKLLQEFISNYQFVNATQTQKPTFYVYF
ncbi:MAG: hypothetical protein V4489_07645 [Chlamydiota bacterium]